MTPNLSSFSWTQAFTGAFIVFFLSAYARSASGFYFADYTLFENLAPWVAAILAGWLFGWRSK